MQTSPLRTNYHKLIIQYQTSLLSLFVYIFIYYNFDHPSRLYSLSEGISFQKNNGQEKNWISLNLRPKLKTIVPDLFYLRDDLNHHTDDFSVTPGFFQAGFWSKGGKIVGLLVLVKSFRSGGNEALTGDSYQMSYQVIWYCLGMREILNVPFDSIKYVTFSIPVILIRRLLSTGPLQKHSVNTYFQKRAIAIFQMTVPVKITISDD